MSISQKRRRSKTPSKLRRILSLQSALSFFLAILVYTALSTWVLSPKIQTVDEKEGSLLFLSTDCNDPLRGSLVTSIDSAKSSLLVITYTLSDKKIVSSLRNAAERGISVTVIFDPTASPETPFLLGKKIASFGRRGSGLMHQKLIVIDENIIWLGSTNMTSSSLLQHGNIMTCIRSVALAKAISSYGNTLQRNFKTKDQPLQIHTESQTLTFFLHPFHAEQSFDYLLEKIQGAKRRIFVAMYTFTHDLLVRALVDAKKRGVDVKVLFDKDSILQTSRKVYTRCKREGVFCSFRKKAGLLHYKTAVIDNCLVIGSANWTKAAFKVNDECLLFIEPLSLPQQNWVEKWWRVLEGECTYD